MYASVVGCMAKVMSCTRFSRINARLLLGGVVALVLQVGTALAESNQSDEQLAAAERALLEGLSTKGVGAFDEDGGKPTSPQPELQPATYSVPSVQPEAERAASVPKKEAVRDVAIVPVTNELNAGMKRELDVSRRRVADLERQLEEVKGQLTMAETELSRLATISEARNRASFGRAPAPAAAVLPQQQNQPKARFEAPAIEPTPSSASDLTIATVDVEKAELRLGPGKNHSALMTVAKGSRLAVEARQGEWLRVFAPNGQRAWILGKLVAFGSKQTATSATSAVRVRGYSSSLEDEAFKRVQAMTAKQ